MWIAKNTGEFVDTEVKDWAFFEQKRVKDPMSQLEEHYYALNESDNISIVAAYRKTKDASFAVPMQGRYVNDAVDDIRDDYKNPDTRQDDHTYDHIRSDQE